MHYVKHGSGPDFLQGTPNAFERACLKWCDLYKIESSGLECSGIGPDKVLNLKSELARIFGAGRRGRGKYRRNWPAICAYCEVQTGSSTTVREIDHFRPQSLYPQLIFRWDNLMYSCHQCNHNKGNAFPEDIGGYISPSDPHCSAYFEYNFNEHKIMANRNIDDDIIRLRIKKTICDLKLNSELLRKDRKKIKDRMDDKRRKYPHKGFSKLFDEFTGSHMPFSSYATAYRAHLQRLSTGQ